MSKMKETILAIVMLFVISAAFSYSYIPQITSGDFDVFSEIDNANESDFVLLLPPNWSINDIQYYGNLTSKEIQLKNLYGNEYLALHLSFNSKKVYIHTIIHPSSSGYVYLYNIKDNGNFERKVVFVKLMPNTIIIPLLLSVLPFWVFFSHEGFIKPKIRKKRRLRRKKK